MACPTTLQVQWSRLGRGFFSESQVRGQMMLGRRPGVGLALEKTWMAIAEEAVVPVPGWIFYWDTSGAERWWGASGRA